MLTSLLFAFVLAAAPLAAPLSYCYRTLADVVCYPTPDFGREARFTGSYPIAPETQPAPADTSHCTARARASPRDLLTGATSPPCPDRKPSE